MDVSSDTPGTLCRLSISKFIKCVRSWQIQHHISQPIPHDPCLPMLVYLRTLFRLTSLIAQIRWWWLSWRRPQNPPLFSTDDRTTDTKNGAMERQRNTHQENNKLLEWLEPVSPVVPARQQVGWTYVDMPESSTCAGRENHWCQSLALDLVHSPGTSCCDLFLSFIFTHTACKWS